MTGSPATAEATCVHCGSHVHVNAPFCGVCGKAVVGRALASPAPAPPRMSTPTPAPTPRAGGIVGAGRGVRCCSSLMDAAVMLSPALPLSILGAALGVAEVVYIVVPIAFVAVWLWMQIWQGITGLTFGKAMLGLRLVRADDRRTPGLFASLLRSGVFVVTAGGAALPVISDASPRDGVHDRIAGLTMIDVARGANPLGPSPQVPLRRSVDRRLNTVRSPVPSGRR
ncbi:RDD family protein [Mycobacterium sp. PSTR-4-N]|uniref:RDD family protein n=1 Tax=Mycobacterium sp. PSTR-4-N TaxID=2917745 RepID=UPI001F151AD0|nr:RDD family protein [Mycobacterium sp. PSTR-4-N]MCG7592734.1 RDD family protein [Mycobacterium sp. PSTR-4-N]